MGWLLACSAQQRDSCGSCMRPLLLPEGLFEKPEHGPLGDSCAAAWPEVAKAWPR